MSTCSPGARLWRGLMLVSLGSPLLLAQWSQQPALGHPPAVDGATITWLEQAHVAVLVGGWGSSGPAYYGTWLYDGRGWRLNTTGGRGLFDACAAPDPARGRTLYFGGLNGNQPWSPPMDSFAAFDGQTWRPLTTAHTPPARGGAMMVYDRHRDRVVLHGGSASLLVLDDTWEYDGTDWTQVQGLTVRPMLWRAAAAYDEVRAQVVLFGGADGIGEQDATWAYDGHLWRQLTTTGPVPPARTRAAMVSDPDRGVLTLFGGERATGILGDTWEFDGVAWTQLQGSGPSPRSGATMTFDADRRCGLLFGGSAGGDETWALLSNPRAFAAPFGDTCDGRTLDRSNGSLPETGSIFRLDLQGIGAQSLVVGVMGSSAEHAGSTALPVPLPVANTACQQQIDVVFPVLLPSNGLVANWALAIPNHAALVGYQGYLQGFELEPTAGGLVVHTSNSVEYRIGTPVLQYRVAEDFTSAVRRDHVASAGPWSGGQLGMGLIGGDGRHGSFDPAFGTQVAQDIYEFSTDNQVIPASATLSGQAETVTDGRFFFTDFFLPQNVTVRFTGTAPLQLFVRGRAEVQGRIAANGADMTTFDCRSSAQATVLPGQPGGRGGPGAGRGGDGGDRCLGTGYQPNYDGNDGDDVQLRAGHAYAGNAIGTGGKGSLAYPSTCLMVSPTSVRATFLNIYSGQCAPGGGGGGFWQPGSNSSVATSTAVVASPPSAAGGYAFNLFPAPVGSNHLDHYLVGGSGGGGGGSHPFYALAITGYMDLWKAGAGGAGGGGALAIRAGGDLVLASTALIEAHGGNGTNFADRGATTNRIGNACPGGGGSGGSVLLQSGAALSVFGSINTAGGTGSTIANATPPNASIPGTIVRGGDGSPGTYRFEAPQTPTVNPFVLVPTLQPGSHIGTLQDRDSTSGSRSLFVALPSAGANVSRCERYEIEAIVNGAPVRYSDDPAFGLPADNPLGPVFARFQAGRLSGTAAVANGPWRTAFGTDAGQDLNRDLPTHARFDLVLNDTAGTVVVRAVRLYCR